MADTNKAKRSHCEAIITNMYEYDEWMKPSC
jgi:hypothetical protein